MSVLDMCNARLGAFRLPRRADDRAPRCLGPAGRQCLSERAQLGRGGCHVQLPVRFGGLLRSFPGAAWLGDGCGGLGRAQSAASPEAMRLM